MSCLKSLCSLLLLNLALYNPLTAMHQQAEKDIAGIDANAGAGGGVIAGAFAAGAGDSDEDDHRPSTRPRSEKALIASMIANGILVCCVLGLIGGWVGEHFSHDDCPPTHANHTNYTNHTNCTNNTNTDNTTIVTQEICRLCQQIYFNATNN